MKSKIDMHQNQSVMFDRTIQDEIREQNELKRKNEELKARLNQSNPQMANQFQTSHRQNEVQHVRAQMVQSQMPHNVLPDNILDQSKNSGYSNHDNNHDNYRNGSYNHMEAPRLSQTSQNHNEAPRLSQQNFGHQSGVSNHGYYSQAPNMMGHQSGGNFKKQSAPQVSGNNP